MSALTEYFCTPLREPRSAWSVINWWESRRAVYNLSVGAAGLVSLGALALFASLPPHPAHVVIPWEAIPVYALLANLGYSLGPATDLVIRRRWGDQYAVVGPALFRYGFVFSVGLTLLPAPLAALSWLVRIVISVAG